jgi:hypothetical protein
MFFTSFFWYDACGSPDREAGIPRVQEHHQTKQPKTIRSNHHKSKYMVRKTAY